MSSSTSLPTPSLAAPRQSGFGTLPFELRIKIWKYFIETYPSRELELLPVDDKGSRETSYQESVLYHVRSAVEGPRFTHSGPSDIYDTELVQYKVRDIDGPPASLFVSSESRTETMKHYKLMFKDLDGDRKFWFRPNHDTLSRRSDLPEWPRVKLSPKHEPTEVGSVSIYHSHLTGGQEPWQMSSLYYVRESSEDPESKILHRVHYR